MATLKKSSDQTKHYEELAQRFLTCLKFRLSQDGVAFREELVERLGRWLVSKPKRVVRYEAADMKLVDEFLDFAWSWVVDPKAAFPAEPAEPQKVPGQARVARPPDPVDQPWWRQPDVVAANRPIDWNVIYEAAGLQQQQEVAVAGGQANVIFDPNVPGNWRVVNR